MANSWWVAKSGGYVRYYFLFHGAHHRCCEQGGSCMARILGSVWTSITLKKRLRRDRCWCIFTAVAILRAGTGEKQERCCITYVPEGGRVLVRHTVFGHVSASLITSPMPRLC